MITNGLGTLFWCSRPFDAGECSGRFVCQDGLRGCRATSRCEACTSKSAVSNAHYRQMEIRQGKDPPPPLCPPPWPTPTPPSSPAQILAVQHACGARPRPPFARLRGPPPRLLPTVTSQIRPVVKFLGSPLAPHMGAQKGGCPLPWPTPSRLPRPREHFLLLRPPLVTAPPPPSPPRLPASPPTPPRPAKSDHLPQPHRAVVRFSTVDPPSPPAKSDQLLCFLKHHHLPDPTGLRNTALWRPPPPPASLARPPTPLVVRFLRELMEPVHPSLLPHCSLAPRPHIKHMLVSATFCQPSPLHSLPPWYYFPHPPHATRPSIPPCSPSSPP